MSLDTVEDAIRRVLADVDVVRDTTVLHGRDSTGDAAVWVYVTLDASDWGARGKIRELLRKTAEPDETDPVWVYVRFRELGETEDP